MHTLEFSGEKNRVKTILCLGAHCDDIEIGCGGALLRLIEELSDFHIYWVILSSNPEREKEAKASADEFLKGHPSKTIKIKNFRNGFFPYVAIEIKEYFESIKTDVSPDIVFTHYKNDLHQDHRLVGELTWNTFRNHLILEYEIPKYDGGLGSPNFFIPLDYEHYTKKTELLLACFESQSTKHWFTEETFRALMRLRGLECNAASGYAEAFYCRKTVL